MANMTFDQWDGSRYATYGDYHTPTYPSILSGLPAYNVIRMAADYCHKKPRWAFPNLTPLGPFSPGYYRPDRLPKRSERLPIWPIVLVAAGIAAGWLLSRTGK